MSDYISMAELLVRYAGPLVLGLVLGLTLLRRHTEIDELSLAETEEIHHPVALPLPAAPPALAESVPEAPAIAESALEAPALAESTPEALAGRLFHDNGHATGQNEGNAGDRYPRLGDTLCFRKERVLEDQDSNADAGSSASNDAISHVAVIEDGDISSEEAVPAMLSNQQIPVAQRLFISDATVYGTGASFNSVSEAWPIEFEYGHLMNDLVTLERASNPRNRPLIDHQMKEATAGDSCNETA